VETSKSMPGDSLSLVIAWARYSDLGSLLTVAVSAWLAP